MTFSNFWQSNICFRFSVTAPHSLQLIFLYPSFPAHVILPHLILAHCSSSLSFTSFSPQYFSYPTIFFHSPHSGQYLDVSIRYQSSCVVWSLIILQPSHIFVKSYRVHFFSQSSHCLHLPPSSSPYLLLSTLKHFRFSNFSFLPLSKSSVNVCPPFWSCRWRYKIVRCSPAGINFQFLSSRLHAPYVRWRTSYPQHHLCVPSKFLPRT